MYTKKQNVQKNIKKETKSINPTSGRKQKKTKHSRVDKLYTVAKVTKKATDQENHGQIKQEKNPENILPKEAEEAQMS